MWVVGPSLWKNGKCEYKDLSITLIERVSEKTLKFLADRELWWQHQLRVFVERVEMPTALGKTSSNFNSAGTYYDNYAKICEFSFK